MKKVLFWASSILMNFVLINCFFIRTVQAYIDPSAVTYIIQAVAAVVVAIGACLTIFRHKIAKLFKKNKDDGKKEVHFTETESEENSVE